MEKKQQLSQAIATVERQISEAKSETAKKALTAKLGRLKEDLRAEKSGGVSSLTTLSQARKVVKALDKTAFEKLVEKLSEKPEYAFLKDYSQDRLRRDALRTAKPRGYRFKGDSNAKPTIAQIKKGLKDGTVYYEGRPIRSDVNSKVRLAKGGHVSKGEMVWNKLSKAERLDFLYENFTPQITPITQEAIQHKRYVFLPKNVKIVLESKYANVEEYATGGGIKDSKYKYYRTYVNIKKGFDLIYFDDNSDIDGDFKGTYETIELAEKQAKKDGYTSMPTYNRYAKGGGVSKRKTKGDIGKSGTQYAYTLKEYEAMAEKNGLFVSPSEFWKSQEGTKYEDSFGRTQTTGERDKEQVMMGYGYRIAIGLDLGSKKIPASAKKYVEENNLSKYGQGGNVDSDISKYKKQLITKAKAKGLYENFGQDEVRKLEDKYGYTSEVRAFDNWAMNFDLSSLRQYGQGGNIEFRSLAKSNNFDIIVPEGRFEVELDSNKKVKSVVHPSGERHHANECPIYQKYKKEIKEYLTERFENGGNIASFNWKNFTLKELSDALPDDVEILKYDTRFIKGFSPSEAKNFYTNKKLTISQHGEAEISKGSENIYLEIKCYNAEDKNDMSEYEVKIYSKENHAGLKEVANSVIEKMKDGGSIGFIPMDLENDLAITAQWGGTNVNGVIGILNAMIDSGITDEDLKPRPAKNTTFQYKRAVEKNVQEIWKKIQPKYKGDFKGNMYYSTIKRLVERSNSGDDILKKFKPFRKNQKDEFFKQTEYKVFNFTDKIYATDETFKTEESAEKFIKEFRKRYEKQGYYRDNEGNKINPNEIGLKTIESDFNPYTMFKDGGSVGSYTYLPKSDISKIVLKSKQVIGKDRILDGAYIKEKLLKGTKSSKSTKISKSAEQVYNDLINYVKETYPKLKFGENKDYYFTESMIQELIDANYSEREIKGFVLGLNNIIKVDSDNEFIYLDGLQKYGDEYKQKYINLAVEASKNNAFELGLKYPNFNWKQIITKYKIDLNPVLITRKREHKSGEYDVYTIVCFVGKDIVIGGTAKREHFKDGKLDYETEERNPSEIKGQFNEGYWGIVSSKKQVIVDVAEMLLSQKEGYVKEMDFLINDLGGVGSEELVANKIKFAKGGNISNESKNLSSMTGASDKAIENFFNENGLDHMGRLKVTMGVGRGHLSRKDFATAIAGEKGNKYAKEIIDYVKTDRAFKMAKGGNLGYTYIPNEDIEKIIGTDGTEYGEKVILDGAYVTDKIRTPKMSRTQFEEETYSFGNGGNLGKSLYVANSSFFDYNPYDTKLITGVLKAIGAKNIRLESESSNLPEVVVFNGDKFQAREALNSAFDTDMILVYEKDWRKSKFEHGGTMGRVKVGVFNEAQLRSGEDKRAIAKAQEETGLTYIDSKITKKGGKMFMEVYLVPTEEYLSSSKMARGGGVNSPIKLYVLDKLNDGTIRLQSQLYLGRQTADFIMKDGVVKLYGRGKNGFDFYEYDKPYQIIEKNKMAHGGGVESDRLFNFLKDDLTSLEIAIKENDEDKIYQFFSYWNQHLDSLKSESNERMLNFLKDDLEELQEDIEENDQDDIDIFFSYWGQHLESIKYATGGNLDEFEDKLFWVMTEKDNNKNIVGYRVVRGDNMTGYSYKSKEEATIKARELNQKTKYVTSGNLDEFEDNFFWVMTEKDNNKNIVGYRVVRGDNMTGYSYKSKEEATIKARELNQKTKYATGGGVNVTDIKKEKQKMLSELFEKCGVFFAFSDKQFEENKTPLKEGEKYVSIGGGGYLPKGKVKEFQDGMEAIERYGKEKVKKNNLAEAEILDELQNHECFYTGDISDVVDLFEGTYTVKQIRDVYNKYREENQEYALGGEITAEEREQALKNYPTLNL